MTTVNPYYQPSTEPEPGWGGDFNGFGGLKNLKPLPLRESRVQEVEEAFDDTHKIATVDQRRKREAQDKSNNPNFQRGIPTNNATSSKNYTPDHVRIIRGEHVSLLKNGVLTEAMDDDDHRSHILEHRYMLGDNLTETMRSALLEHISQHTKLLKKGVKQTKEDLGERAKRRFGPAVANRAALRHNSDTDSKIPQDSKVSAELKRSAGMVSMEARNRGRGQRFQSAMRVRRGL